jgi:hypothetical protein
MDAHNHLTPVHLGATILGVVAVFGTLHLLALTSRSRAARAWLALGF